jgi:hypothetical protein
MAQTDRVVQIRAIQGINRLEDSRLGDPGSWYTTQNLYGRAPGVLAKRPGSSVLVLPENTDATSAPAVGVTTSQLGAGEVLALDTITIAELLTKLFDAVD